MDAASRLLVTCSRSQQLDIYRDTIDVVLPIGRTNPHVVHCPIHSIVYWRFPYCRRVTLINVPNPSLVCLPRLTVHQSGPHQHIQDHSPSRLASSRCLVSPFALRNKSAVIQ